MKKRNVIPITRSIRNKLSQLRKINMRKLPEANQLNLASTIGKTLTQEARDVAQSMSTSLDPHTRKPPTGHSPHPLYLQPLQRLQNTQNTMQYAPHEVKSVQKSLQCHEIGRKKLNRPKTKTKMKSSLKPALVSLQWWLNSGTIQAIYNKILWQGGQWRTHNIYPRETMKTLHHHGPTRIEYHKTWDPESRFIRRHRLNRMIRNCILL